MTADRTRQISEETQGTQVVLCHIVCRPDPRLSRLLGLEEKAMAILTLTPAEAIIAAADRMTKAAEVRPAFVDRYRGTVVLTGGIDALESALEQGLELLSGSMRFAPVPITKS